jgi:hypothetical protein
MRAISAFSFAAFAMVEATSTQVRQNETLQSTISRRPSRIIARRPQQRNHSNSNPNINGPSTLVPSSSSRTLGPPELDPDQLSNSLLQGTSVQTPQAQGSYVVVGGEEVYLRVRIPIPGLQAVVTTLKVTTQTYLADVLETLIRKRKEHLQDSKDWVLMLGDQDIIAPTDRTVESLQGNYNLRLVKKIQVSDLLRREKESAAGRLANTNPSASIFKRLSEPQQPKYVTASDISGPQKWNVFRKHAMSLGRHERVLSSELVVGSANSQLTASSRQ